jgi:hypothetical protein
MNQFFNVTIYIVLILVAISLGHQIYIYIQNTYTPKITKDIYRNQIEKYKDIVKELQDTHQSESQAIQDKIEMENDLQAFVEESVKQYK